MPAAGREGPAASGLGAGGLATELPALVVAGADAGARTFAPGAAGLGLLGEGGAGLPADGTLMVGTLGGSSACETNAVASMTTDAASPTSAK
ncbi:MAG TPA: hypothetical protein VGH32_01590 [Pirellulales bacterium]